MGHWVGELGGVGGLSGRVGTLGAKIRWKSEIDCVESQNGLGVAEKVHSNTNFGRISTRCRNWSISTPCRWWFLQGNLHRVEIRPSNFYTVY